MFVALRAWQGLGGVCLSVCTHRCVHPSAFQHLGWEQSGVRTPPEGLEILELILSSDRIKKFKKKN